jgi:tape measure domain-containing protein
MKTLGIKFQVAGVKEAQAALNGYKTSLNQSLQQNKQAVEQSVKNANKLSARKLVRGRRTDVAVDYEDKEIISAYRVAPKKRKNPGQITAKDRREINDASAQAVSRYELGNKDQNIVEGVAQGTKEGLEEFNNKLDTLTSESQTNLNRLETNFSRSLKDSFISSKAKEINTNFYGGIGQEAGRQTFVGVQNLIRSFLGLEEQRDTVNLSDKSIALLAGSIGAVVKANRFTPSDLQISIPKLIEKPQDKNGQKTGLINSLLMPVKTVKYGFLEGIGASFGHQYAKGFGEILNSKLDLDFERKGQVGGMTAFHVKETGIPEFIKNIKETSNLFEKFDLNLIKQFSKTATSLPGSVITGYRKGSVEIEGLRKLQKLADEIKDEDLPDLTEKKRWVQLIGGFAAEEGRSGFRMADELKNSASDDTAVTGVSNDETDLTFSVFGNKALWGANLVQKIVDLNLKGYNTDSVKMAAQVLAVLKKYPDLEEIRISGHSAGGFNVEEVQEMLDLLKQVNLLSSKTKITTIASGTPQTIGGLNNPNTEQIVGDRDDIIKDVEKVGEFLGVVKPRGGTDLKGVASHYGGDYLVAEDYLKALLGDGFDKEKNKKLKKSRSPFKGQLIEIEQLYLKYLAAFDRDLDELVDELSIAPDRLLAKARAAKISGKPQEQAITKLNTRDFERFNLKSATKTAVVVVNGLGGEGGNSGVTMANSLAKMTNDPNTQFFGGKNPHTDTFTREQLEGEDVEKVAEMSIKHVAKLFYEAHALGVNQDSIEIAAQTLDMQQQNPDLDIKLLGNSFGGYIVEDVIALLKVMGADMKRIKAIAVGTPELPGGIKNSQFQKYLGENDGVFGIKQVKAINKRAKELTGFDLLPELNQKNQNLPNINIHDLGEYIDKSSEIQDFIFGLQNSIDELLDIEQKIQDKSDRAQAIPAFVENLRNNPNLSEEDKIANLLILRDQYVATLQDIVILSEKAKKLGGGRRFTKRGKEAARELERINPTNQTTTNPSTPQPDVGVVTDDPWEDAKPQEQEAITNRFKALAQQYKQYLQSLSQKTKSDRSVISQVIARDFAASDSNKQKELLAFIKQDFNAKAKAYRAAVKSGQLELAKEQGEQLIKLAASVKSLYGELANFDQLEPEVQTQFKSYQRYVTSAENEVLTGTGRKGGTTQGLPDLFEGQLNLSAEDGENVAEGFVNGILENLQAARSAGEQLIDAVDQGIRDAGEIQSPSELAKRLGKWFVQGFSLGLKATKDLEQRGKQVVEETQKGIKQQFREKRINLIRSLFDFGRDSLDSAVESAPQVKSTAQKIKNYAQQEISEVSEDIRDEFSEEIEEVQNSAQGKLTELEDFFGQYSSDFLSENIAKFFDASGAGVIKKVGSLLFDASQNGGFEKIVNTIGNLAGKLIRLIITFKLLKVALDALGLGKLVEGFSNLPSEAINAAVAVEALDRRIVDMSGSAQAGAKNLGFITAEAKRLNKSLTGAKENYSKIISSTRDTALEGFQSEKIYTAFANTAKAKGLSSAEEERLFTAVQQIIGKQVLSQEEVRQQIGELLGDFPQTLAEAYGVSVPQLNKMIESGELLATDALPKAAALLNAKNGIAGEANTGAAAVQRLDNAIVSFRENVGSVLLPMQKFGNNFLAGFFNNLGGLINQLKSLVNGFFLALFINLLRLEIFGQSVQKILLGLIKLLWTMKGAIAIFAVEMVLISAAWTAWSNVLKQFNQRFFPQINKDIDNLTKGMKAYRQAIDEARGAQSDLNGSKLQLAEGFKLPENRFGDVARKVIGSDYVNLDSLIREPLDKALSNKYSKGVIKAGIDNFVPGGRLISPFINGSQTVRENKQDQLKIDNSNLSLKGNQILLESQEAFKATEEITKYDAQIAEIQSARLKLLPGDQDALKSSLEEEKKINELRDKELKIVTAYQQTLTSSANAFKSRLEDLEQRNLNDEIEKPVYEQEKNNLQGLLADTEAKLKGVNDELSRVSTRLSEFQRRLRNSNERVEGFLSQSDRELQYSKAEIIESGIESGTGTQVIQLELESAQQQDLSRRIDFLKQEISAIEKDLKSPELSAAASRIKQNLAEKNIPLNESSLTRIAEESTVKADKDAAQGLLDQLRRETQLSGLSEQLASTLQQNRNALIDFNRTISDYFFRINQQIKEAQLEVTRIVNQIVQTQIRNKLQSALSPNSESFVNQLISSTQSLLDQAASYAEKVLGQKGARIQFAGQKRTLEMELQDFARNVSGASEALAVFEQRLKSGEGASPPSSSTTQSSDTLTALRRAIIGKESGTNFKAVNPHSGALGYGQVMPANVASWTKEALGRTMTSSEFLNDSLAQVEVINYKLNQYLQKELNQGFDLDTAVRRVASTWYSGQPNLYNNTKAQSYNGGKYPSIDSYTTDILSRFKSEGGVSKKADGRGLGGLPHERPVQEDETSDVLNVPKPPSFNTVAGFTSLPAPPPEADGRGLGALPHERPVQEAEKLTNEAIALEEQKLNLQDDLVNNQEKESLQINLDNAFASDRRRVENEIKERQFQLDDTIFAQFDLLSQYDYQTPDLEAARSINSVNKAFSDRNREVGRQVQFYTDEITALKEVIGKTDSLLAIAQTDEEKQIVLENDANAKLLLPVYQENLAATIGQQTELVTGAETALYFVREQNKLKIEQSDLTKANTILEQQANLAAQRGTLEERRQLKIKQEEQRLEFAINQIRQNTPEGVQRNEEILGELRISKVNNENIDYDSQLEELDIERKLLDYQSQITDKRASQSSRFGLNFGAEKLKQEAAIAQEKLRFERELIELEKTHKGDPKKLEELVQAATELHNVNLTSVKNEFKSLGKTVEDYFGSAAQGFFTNFTTNFFDGKSNRDRAELEERLRYAEEVVGLENQYREEPGHLAHLKNRARELNEEKLDKIRGEFNLFSRTVDLAKQALLEFVKQLAALAAQQAAQSAISSVLNIFSGAGGGYTKAGSSAGKGIGAAIGKAFKADQGWTVGDPIKNYSNGGNIKARKLTSRVTNFLKANYPGVAQAWNAEGEGAQLGVFHTGEELLSRKTGEAGRYQALKARYGINPLDKIERAETVGLPDHVPRPLVFAAGGTVGDLNSRLLATMPKSSPRIDLSEINQVKNQSAKVNKSVSIHTTVVTPNADSFRLNQDQLNQDLVERIRRGI